MLHLYEHNKATFSKIIFNNIETCRIIHQLRQKEELKMTLFQNVKKLRNNLH